MKKRIRPAAVAGFFYPAQKEKLEATVQDYLGAAVDPLTDRPKALIVPHAGFVYSGPVAASAYKMLESYRDEIRRVVLIGPAHRVPFPGIAGCHYDAFETPLGSVPVDREAMASALEVPTVKEYDRAHEPEHSLEVQLPFLQLILRKFSIVPFVVGDARAEDIHALIEKLWGGSETLLLISSDLSHYLDYAEAKTVDGATIVAIQEQRWPDLDHDHACGCLPIQGLLMSIRERSMKVDILDVRNSGDTAGTKEKVVGYGAFAIS